MASSDTASSSDAVGGGGEDHGGRNLIVDEAFFEEQFLRCQVCNERFDQAERQPKSLPCNHTFCLPCLTQIFDHAQPPNRRTLLWAEDSLDGALKCPTCRVEIFLARNKIKELPNDHRVVQMMDFLSQAVAKSHNACPKHERQPLNFFCKKCLVPVCRDCTVLDHKEADGHNITDVSEAMNENSTQFAEIENSSRLTLEKMKSRSDSLANASKRLDIMERRMKGEIKESFIEYRLLLEKRQEAMTDLVHQHVKDQKALINSRYLEVCETGTQLQKLYDEFKSSRNSNDIRKLFTINQEMKDNENNFTQCASQEDNELFKACEFESVNEGAFLTEMSSLGEVRPKEDPDMKLPVSAHQLRYLDMELQRERQRQIESQAVPRYNDCEETYPGSTNLTDEANMDDYGYGQDYNNYVDDEEEADDPRDIPHLNVSRLISRYMREVRNYPDPHVAMDDDTPEPAESRMSSSNRMSSSSTRRGRRSRDTNSSQVLTSIEPSREDVLRAARADMLRADFTPPSMRAAQHQARSGSRGRTGGERAGATASPTSNYRVVRHHASNRHQAPRPQDD